MVIFEPKEHRYFNIATKDEYSSVSTVIGKFKPKFDTDKWSKYIADKEGVKQEEIIKRWDKTRDEASEKGKRIHKIIELYLSENKTEYTNLFKNFVKLLDSEREENTTIHTEKIVYNHMHKVAGTADMIEDCGRYFNVYDIKTNKKFNFVNTYNERMLAPLDHLSVCEYSGYSIQLSIYAYMYHLMTGKYVGKLKIFYNTDSNWMSIPVGYMKDSVEKILPIFKYQ